MSFRETLFTQKEGNDHEIHHTNETLARVVRSRIRGCAVPAKRRPNSNPITTSSAHARVPFAHRRERQAGNDD